MGRVTLIARLIARDLRRRPAQAALLLLVITVGPDVVASYTDLPPMPRGATPTAALAAMAALTRAPGVVGQSGPYPVGWATLRIGRLSAGVIAEGRESGRAAVDQPKLTEGNWVSADGVVIERSFAQVLGARVGERVTLNGKSFRVAGIAVTAATAPYPAAGYSLSGSPFTNTSECGLIWVTDPTARSFATRSLPQSYVLNLRLASPAAAPAFAAAHSASRFQNLLVLPWQQIAQQDNNLILNEQRVLLVGSWLLGVLAVASVAVIVGGRLAEQTRRVGLLKAVGATPGLVAVALLAENLLLAVAAATAGLCAGWLAAPLLTRPGSGLVGTAGAPSLTLATAGWVAVVAVAVAMLATFVPALSRRLPVPLLLGLRLAARRPWRSVLSGVSVGITAATIVAVLTVHAHQVQVATDNGGSALSALANPRYERVDQVLLVLTVMLAVLAAVNALFITQATAVDARTPPRSPGHLARPGSRWRGRSSRRSSCRPCRAS